MYVHILWPVLIVTILWVAGTQIEPSLESNYSIYTHRANVIDFNINAYPERRQKRSDEVIRHKGYLKYAWRPHTFTSTNWLTNATALGAP